MRAFPLALILLALVTLSGCSRHRDDDEPVFPYNPSSSLTSADEQLIAGYNELGWKLLRHQLNGNKNTNVLLSPFSIASALTMAQNGAGGATRQEMNRVLGLTHLKLPDINVANAKLRDAWKNPDSRVELAVGNSLWAQQSVAFNPNFLRVNNQSFGAQISELDLNSSQAVQTVNDWANHNTKGKIPTIVDHLDANARMVLVNAVYFKGAWKRTFDPGETKNDTFHLANGSTEDVAMMNRTGQFLYNEDKGFQAINLPYGDGRLSLYVFLADEKTPLSQWIQTVTPDKWQMWMKGFTSRKGHVALPHFKLDFSVDLVPKLKALGMRSAFELDKANFSGIRPERDLFIGEVQQRAIIEVNEEGTEAAAVAGNTFHAAANAVSTGPFEFVTNRPFLAALRDNETGSLLFLTAVVAPS